MRIKDHTLKTFIPAGTYSNQQYDVPTFGVKTLLICREDLGFEEAYQMAKTLYEQAERLSQEYTSLWSLKDKSFIATDLPIEVHPGAKAFYEEMGLIP